MGIGTFYIPLGVYIIGIIVALLTIFVRTELGLVYLVLLIPLQNIMQKVHTFPFGNQLVNILVVSMILGWIIRGHTKEGGFAQRTPLNLPALLYIGITFISLLWGSFYLDIDFPIDLDNSRFVDWKNLIMLPIIYFITVNNVKDEKWAKIILGVTLFSISLAGLFFYREFRWYKEWHYTHDMRVSGSFFYLGPNELGAFFAQYGVLLFSLVVYTRKNWNRILFGFVFLVCLYCLLYTFSRAAYFAFPIGIAFILFFRNKAWLILFIILLVLSPKFLPVSVVERIDMTVESEEERAEGQTFDRSTEARFTYTEKSIEFFKESPILGTGFRTFVILVGMDTHNNYAKLLAESGVLGFGIYLVLYWVAIKMGWRLYKGPEDDFKKGLGLGFIGCVITNMIVNVSHDCWSYLNLMGLYWVIMGLVWRYSAMLKKV